MNKMIKRRRFDLMQGRSLNVTSQHSREKPFPMDCNKDQAVWAKQIAEKKMESNDFDGALKIALKAQNLYPELENITQILSICNVHCSSHKKIIGAEKDWYEILQVEKFAEESIVRKQYRRLALILHPDKNRFPGAEAAFKLICEANAVLSDPTKKTLYDSKIRVTKVGSAVVNPPPDMKQNYQFNTQYGDPKNVSNSFSYSDSGESSEWCGSRKTVRPEPGVSKNTRVEKVCKFAKVGVGAKGKGVNISDGNSSLGKKVVDGDAKTRETRNMKNKKTKGRKHVVSSSDSDIKDLIIKKDFNSGPSHVRRSSRKRQNITYNEVDDDDDDDDEVDDDDDGEDPKQENQNGNGHREEIKGTKFDKKIKGDNSDPIIIETDSDIDSNIREHPKKDIRDSEDFEFIDFDQYRDERYFSGTQVWACYDSDGMPRFYAKVKKVPTPPFELSITCLEASKKHPNIHPDIPVSCGIFKLGKTMESGRLKFSHRMDFLRCKNEENSFTIYPREGQVWALYRYGESNPDELIDRYEVVEILSNFNAKIGLAVHYLDKVRGLVSIFQRRSTASFLLKPNQLHKFSHSIPCFKMTGSKEEGVPEGSFKLDPAALPPIDISSGKDFVDSSDEDSVDSGSPVAGHHRNLRPFFEIEIKNSGFLYLPKSFDIDAWFCKPTVCMTYPPSESVYTVELNYYAKTGYSYLSKGWSAFTKANKLVVGRRYLFELLRKNFIEVRKVE